MLLDFYYVFYRCQLGSFTWPSGNYSRLADALHNCRPLESLPSSLMSQTGNGPGCHAPLATSATPAIMRPLTAAMLKPAAAVETEGPFGEIGVAMPVPSEQLPLGPLPNIRYANTHIESMDKRFKGSVGTGAVVPRLRVSEGTVLADAGRLAFIGIYAWLDETLLSVGKRRSPPPHPPFCEFFQRSLPLKCCYLEAVGRRDLRPKRSGPVKK